MFPNVDCARLITLSGSPHFRTFAQRFYAFRPLGPELMIQMEQRDRDGSLAGVWRAHVRAWRAGFHANCSHMLVLEDDTGVLVAVAVAAVAVAVEVAVVGMWRWQC